MVSAYWKSAAALVLLVSALRLPVMLYREPIDDEVVYAIAGDEIAAGGQLYVSAVERKPPLLLLTYAAMAAEDGGHWSWLHVYATLWVLATMAGLYVAAARLFDHRTGVTAAFLYALFHQWWYPSNLAFNGEMLMNLPIAWAFASAFSVRRSTRPFGLFLAGVLIALAAMLKQPAAIAVVPLVFYAGADARRSDASVWRSVGYGFVSVLGFATVVIVAGIWLSAKGLLGEAWYWSVGDHDVPHIFWQYLWQKTLHFLAVTIPLTTAAWWSARGDDVWAGREAERDTLKLLTVASAIGVAASGRFYPHYYIALVVPLALLAAPVVRRWLINEQRAGRWLLRRPLSLVFAATAIAFVSVQSYGLWQRRWHTPIGEYLRAHTDAGDRIFVWGRGTEIYLEAERRPASRYIATFPLTGRIFGTPEYVVDTRARVLPSAWQHLANDFATHPPSFIADLESASSARYPIRDFPFLRDWIATQYAVVFRSPEGVVYRRVSPSRPPVSSAFHN